ncbi:hypothetical protein BHM03_00050771, partial [Ensete ventricosum]
NGPPNRDLDRTGPSETGSLLAVSARSDHHQICYPLPLVQQTTQITRRRRNESMAAASILFFLPKPPPLHLHRHQHLQRLVGLRLPGRSRRRQWRRFDSYPVRATKNGDGADPPDRLLAAVCYLYPFLDGVRYGRFVLTQFPAFQAIVLDVLLIFPDLLERSFNPTEGIGLDLLQSLDSTVFLFLLLSLIYGSSACLLGQVPRLPIVAEAAERQVM